MEVIGFLILGFLLTLLNFDEMFIKAFKELFNKEITTSSYYVIIFFCGVIAEYFANFNQKNTVKETIKEKVISKEKKEE